MPDDYIPQGDSEFLEFANNFISKISGNEANYGLVAGDTVQITAMTGTMQASYDDLLVKKIDARTAREKKDFDRKPLESKLRSAAQVVQDHPGTTDMMRQDLMLTVKDTEQSLIGPPVTYVVGEIKFGAPLQHIINFHDSEAEGKGKPDGVKGAEIFCKIGGEATLNEDDYKYLGTDTASPYLAVHKPENAGQKAHYLLRWVNPKGETGAFGNPVSATITG